MPESQHPEIFRTLLESPQTIAERELRIVSWNDGAEKSHGLSTARDRGAFCGSQLIASDDHRKRADRRGGRADRSVVARQA